MMNDNDRARYRVLFLSSTSSVLVPILIVSFMAWGPRPYLLAPAEQMIYLNVLLIASTGGFVAGLMSFFQGLRRGSWLIFPAVLGLISNGFFIVIFATMLYDHIFVIRQ